MKYPIWIIFIMVMALSGCKEQQKKSHKELTDYYNNRGKTQ